MKNSILRKKKKINSSLWLLTCLTDNVILYQFDPSPGKLQWLRVLSHRCSGSASQVNSIHRSAQWLLWPSLPAQWHSDCGYDSEIPTKHTISIYCKKECSTLSFGMEAFKMREEREEDYRGGKLTKQRGYSGAQGCGGGGGEERSGSHRILLFPTRELKNCNRKRFYSE